MDRPASVTRALTLIWVLLAILVVMTVLAVVLDDDIVSATGLGGSGTADDTRVSPAFSPVVVTMAVCIAVTVLVFLAFFKGGHNWARHCLTAVAASAVLATLAALRTSLPTTFVVGAVVMLLLEVALVVFLYHPDTSRYVAVSRHGPHSESTPSA